VRIRPPSTSTHAISTGCSFVDGKSPHCCNAASRSPCRSNSCPTCSVIRMISIPLTLAPASFSNARAAFLADLLLAPAKTILSIIIGLYSRWSIFSTTR
jgi:hypothetical protein